ncbi:response regulator [Oscillatoria sp. FACHB-1407]|uniref:hybrid sensor histidine kinase/response regulator n=1 Tax=Oscillatoria sp. FACHB-1407 TaxID=2692847 RepID=UPI001687C8BE|nr:hybrid sensor histidine kinase/response regulator [Oscillatoria sp. FACHB-1407]MBD2461909.1 response regulator [Oscillatoria sp. FACHB-1407]
MIYKKSIGARLFFYVLVGALVGLGGTAFFFYRALERQAIQEIENNLSTQVKDIEGKLGRAEQSMVSLVATMTILESIGVKDPEVYKQAIIEMLQKRSSLTVGAGFGQAPYRIFSDRRTFWPYAFYEQGIPNEVGVPLPAPLQNIRLTDICELEPTCFSNVYYTAPVEAGGAIWLEPYDWFNIPMTTVTAPVLSQEGELLGVVGLDITIRDLTHEVEAPPEWGGGYFMILTDQGNLLAYPPDPTKASELATYSELAYANDFTEVWQQIGDRKTGIVQTDSAYWAFEHIDGTNWIMLASVPKSVVLYPALRITFGGVMGAGSILAIVTALFVRQLNRRLNPLLETCKTVTADDTLRRTQSPLDQTEITDAKGDELDILSHAFHSMTSQLQASVVELEQRVEERTHELRIAKDKADTANRAKSQFLANMSHELRTPLNGVLGYAQILQSSPTLTPPEKQGVDVIYNCGFHLLTLINDILDISKIEANRLELEPIVFHFPEFLQSVVKMCRIGADQKDLEFRFSSSANLPISITCDEKRLRQVLINLIGNAVKFTSVGRVSFHVQFTPDTEPSVAHLRFIVSDTGVGIAPEDLEKIFMPFEQTDYARTNSEGTGLGLTISQTIVHLMGSEIEVSSQIGIGSTFQFSISCPCEQQWVNTNHTPFQEQKIKGYKGQQRHILVVDDHWENRAVVTSLLAPLHFQVSEALNGQDALDKLDSLLPDLIIADLAMPVMDGYQMIQHLRQSDQFHTLPIIVSSASVSDSDRSHSLEVGGDLFLPKPVQAVELLSQLQHLLKLEWIYEDTISNDSLINQPIDVSKDTIVFPPSQQLLSLYEAARCGFVRQIIEEVNQFKSSYPIFYQYVMVLVESFDDEAIVQLIEPVISHERVV